MNQTYRRIGLARYIDGLPTPDDFAVFEEIAPEPDEGEFVVRNLYASIDPGARGRLSQADSYIPALPLGETIGSFNVGEVIASRNDRFQEGDRITGAFGWTEMARSSGRGYLQPIETDAFSPTVWIGVLGIPGLTAYFGLKRIGEIASGKTVVVTSAAGMVGATACQIAKLSDCRAVAIAGGPTKCGWLRDSVGVDAAIDYKATDDLAASVRAAAPDGVDILFDNVGNPMIDALLPLMNRNGRIVVSGQVGDANLAPGATHGIRNTRPFITHRVRMEGLVVFDNIRAFPAAQDEIGAWLADGRIVYRERLYDGIAQAPAAFRDVFEGRDFGRHIVRLFPDEAKKTQAAG